MNILAQIKALEDKAHALKASAGDSITAEQITQITAWLDESDELKARAQNVADMNARLGNAPAAASTVAVGAVATVGAPNFTKDPKAGFSHPQEFFKIIAKNRGKAGRDDRLQYLAAVGSDEQNTMDGEYGGFAVPEGFHAETLKVQAQTDPTVGMTKEIPMDAPVVKINARVDKNHATSVTGGLKVYRNGETGSLTSSRQSLEQIKLSVNSLNGLSYSSNELIHDSPSTVAALLADFPVAFADKEFQEKLRGTGVDQFEGIFNSAALITVAKESGQTADTIVQNNLGKMMARCYNLEQASWLMTRDAIPQLLALGNGDNNVWQASSVVGMPSTLYGLPVYFSEYAGALGDLTDIALVNWNEYLTGTYQGMESENSIHVRFENNENAFRFTKRNDGRPWWSSVLTPKFGTTKSPFITLAARA